MEGAPEVPGFEVQRAIGRGGFGTVYAATQLSVRRTIALKVISVVGLDGDASRRFEAETTTVGSLSWHPHVVPLYDAGITPGGLAYLAMELLPAGSVGDAVTAGGPLPPATVIRYGIQIADALDAAHRLGIFHRDIKPDNLLLSERGDVKLADFGIATLSDMTQTAAGGFTGTIAYSAPELFAGQRANPRSEVYGLGATLYALAAGRAPFPAAEETPLSLMWKVANADPPPLPPTVPSALAAVIARAMARDPALRPADAAALQAELEHLGAVPATTSTPPPPPPPPPPAGPVAAGTTVVAAPTDRIPAGGDGAPPRRRRAAVGVGVGVVAALIAAGVVLAVGGGDDPGDDGDLSAGRTTAGADEAPGSTTLDGSSAPLDCASTTVESCRTDDDAAEAAGSTGTPVDLPPGPEGRTLDGVTPCPAEDGSEERVAVFAEAPPDCVPDGEALTAVISVDEVDEDGDATDAGTIVVELDDEAAPTMVDNFVVLSRYGFYDGIPFHRLVPDFVAQVGGSGSAGGDGSPDYGTTGPGYDLPDVEHPTDGYAVGDVAMARSADVSGSQLFIVTSEDGLAALDQAGNYPRFGRVVEGLDLAVEMSQHGDVEANGAPTALYVISDALIRPT